MNYQEEIDEAAEKLKQMPSFGRDAINQALATLFTTALRGSGFSVDAASPMGLYVEALSTGFYDRTHQLIPSRYRECALIAMLASDGDGPNLSYHLFLALMAGLSANDVYDILLLTGMYSGVHRLTTSLAVAHKTFDAVIAGAQAGDRTPMDMFQRIAKAVAG